MCVPCLRVWLRLDCQQEIQQQITDELEEIKLPINPHFHITSIYDHSIFESLSKIVQNLIPQLALLENLLDGLIASCGIEKAFLFDIVSKIYVATDSNPVDMQTYELCSDMIDVVIDVSCIYGLKGKDVIGYDEKFASVIKLSNNYVLYLKEVNRYHRWCSPISFLACPCWWLSETRLVDLRPSCFRLCCCYFAMVCVVKQVSGAGVSDALRVIRQGRARRPQRHLF